MAIKHLVTLNQKTNTVLTPERWIYLYSEIATYVLEYSSLDSIWTNDATGNEMMTEEKQDEYVEIVDVIEEIMRNSGLVKEDI